MDYYQWLEGLKAGDPVVIRHPWQDKDQPGGRRENATVSRVSERFIHIDGYPVFSRETGKTGPYECLEMPDQS